jgi:hypothetical protein
VKNKYNILAIKYGGVGGDHSRDLGICERKIVKMDLTQVKRADVVWIRLILEKDKWHVLVNTIMGFSGSIK